MRYVGWAFVIMVAFSPRPLEAQDILSKHKVRGLQGLRTVTIVVRPNTPREVATPKEWSDLAQVRLHRDIPELKFSPENTANWLEISVLTTADGGEIGLYLYRWVTVHESGEETFAKVWWDSRLIFGGISRKSAEEALETLLTGFAADYLRAQQ